MAQEPVHAAESLRAEPAHAGPRRTDPQRASSGRSGVRKRSVSRAWAGAREAVTSALFGGIGDGPAVAARVGRLQRPRGDGMRYGTAMQRLWVTAGGGR